MSYRPESDIQLLRFELSERCLIYYINQYRLYKKIDNQTHFSIQ
ncbi:unnamed protein product [Linum tenue]|uniref:Uncharacterized protein n=1 Tax=Linum tenue TaxID=586396 RepID=A0AAV0K4D4_9ROSI|nr:unnamed protein product [Linum tenue]CAI0427994.1 unnamed protein product [Linum tenue]CAI0433465.1 unnamed protein product [Linum tenue]